MIKFIGENIFSILTAIIAIVAIWQTHRQIKINNKQFLFENRVRKYTLASSLIQLYKENQTPSIVPKTYPELKKEFDETSHRERLYNAVNQLKNNYEKLQKEIKF